MDENDQAKKKPAEDTQPTQPGDRLRRLAASSQEGDDSLLTGGTGSHKLKPAGEKPAEGEKPAGAEEQAGQPGPAPTEQAQEAAGESQEGAPSEGPSASQAQPETAHPEAPDQKPAGEPEVTNSWFKEVYNRDLGDTQPVGTGPANRHPTGSPESTGGWYGQDMEKTQPPFLNADQTQPSAPGESGAHTPPFIPDPNKTRVLKPEEQTSTPPPYGKDPNILPHRVEEVDLDATQVTPSALGRSQQYSRVGRPTRPAGSTRPTPVNRAPVSRPPQQHQVDTRIKPPAKAKKNGQKRTMGCFLRILIGLLFVVVFAVIGVGSFLVIKYFSIASSLPSVDDLRSKASQFETTRILDRNGNLIYEIIDPNAGKRTFVTLDKISPYIIATTIATEDKDFYTHPGFDPLAIARALWQNYTTGEVVSGASTITQQLARALLLGPEESSQRTVERKAREIVLAAEITRKYSKEDILELYLNENYYGRLAYGVEAAAETYFQTTADKLTLGEAAFLTGIPQSPAFYDIETNRDATLNRFRTVVVLSYQLSQDRNCIDVSTSTHPVCVDQQAAVDAVKEIENYDFAPTQDAYRFPHWIDYIRAELENMYDPNTIYRSGFTVYTTLDPSLQEQAQQIVTDQINQMADNNAHDGALVAIKPSTGEILAMVGSADFYNDAISGQVNMAVSPRQPGSSIKPLTYTAAFEKGWTPATLIWDVPTEFPPSGDPNDTNPPYVPVNYDGKFHGPVTVRTALANSLNIPAVKTLQFVGIYDDPNTPEPDGFINFAKKMGITTLTGDQYGLSLTLGGGDVTLLELTGAYAIFANGGRRVPPVSITKITDYQGNVVYQYDPPAGDQVIRPEHAYLMTSILSDNQARAMEFGTNSVLNLDFPVAAKTGTTNDFRDNWTLGYTPDLAVGVWVGNADYTPMVNTTGLSGAAPIWSNFMKTAIQQLTGGNPTPFSRPAGIVDRVICTVSGTEPSEWCPQQRSEVFAYDQLPLPKEDDLWTKVNIDTWTGLLASSACSDFSEDKFALNVTDASAVKWILQDSDGQNWAKQMGFSQPIFFTPSRECTADDPRPMLLFAGLSEGQTITQSPLEVYALVKVPGSYDSYTLSYGTGHDPAEWEDIYKGGPQSDQPQFLTDWDVSKLPSGEVTLRLYLKGDSDHYATRTIHLNIQVPTPTPTPTSTPTQTFTPTNTPLPSATPSNTPTSPPPTSPPPTQTNTPPPAPSQTPSGTP